MTGPENEKIRNTLDQIDVEKLTLADVRRVRNPAVRAALDSLVQAIDPTEMAAEHTNFGKFTSHLQSHVLDMEIESPEI